MDNTAEYERIFNMTIEERRKLLKEKDQEFKKEYFAYDNRQRARIRREAKKANENSSNISHISHDPILNSNPELFRQKIDDMFKIAQQNAIIYNSNIDIVNEVINNTPEQVNNQPPIQQPAEVNNPPPIQQPAEVNNPINPINNPITPINNPINNPPPIPSEEKPIIDFKDDDVFYQKVVYADLIVARDFCYDDGRDENDGDYTTPKSLKEINNYNIKIPIEYLSEIIIKMPINTNSRMLCDTENMYIFFK